MKYSPEDLQKIYSPFDIVYDHVTEGMNLVAKNERSNWFGLWLSSVIPGFRKERDNWNSAGIDDYIAASKNLSPSFLRLIAGAYLHISYDLPRVMASNLPPESRNDERFLLTIRYRELDYIFKEVTVLTLSDKRVVGWALSRLSWLTKTETLQEVISTRVDVLRSEAIYNSYYISQASNRQYIEGRMRTACTAAIKHVSIWKPWTFQRFKPFRVSTMMAISPIFIFEFSALLFLALILMNVYYLYEYMADIKLFTAELGRRISQYTTVAVRDPEQLDEYINRRGAERFEMDAKYDR